MNPYIDDVIDLNSKIRTFDPTKTNLDEYVWHRDRNIRRVEVLEGVGWKFQFDDELPFYINRLDIIEIPKMVYHRLLPGTTTLKLLITELF